MQAKLRAVRKKRLASISFSGKVVLSGDDTPRFAGTHPALTGGVSCFWAT